MDPYRGGVPDVVAGEVGRRANDRATGVALGHTQVDLEVLLAGMAAQPDPNPDRTVRRNRSRGPRDPGHGKRSCLTNRNIGLGVHIGVTMLAVVAGEEAVDMCAAYGKHAFARVNDAVVTPQDPVARDDSSLTSNPAAICVTLDDGQVELEGGQSDRTARPVGDAQAATGQEHRRPTSDSQR